MDINSLEIKNKTTYVINNISHIDDCNVNSLRVTKKEELMLIFIILDVLLAQMMIL